MDDPQNKALLPAGMHDTLPPHAAQEARVGAQLVALFNSWGYARVSPPLLEFAENLLSGSGAAMAQQAFRVQDPLSQRMMALRPDMTLQVARIARSRMGHAPRPLRLTYAGQVVRIKGSQLRPGRQFGQVGAELIGASTPAADVELILMAVEALENVGIKALSVDLGLPTLASAVIRPLDLDSVVKGALKTALERKDAAAIKAMSGLLGTKTTAIFSAMLEAVGTASCTLEKLNAIDLPTDAARERKALQDVMARLKTARPDITLTLDPVERRGFEYHTGVTFALFAHGLMGELGRGGRYGSGPGAHAEPASGLTLYVDAILRTLPVPADSPCVFLPFATSYAQAKALREKGWRTTAALENMPDMRDIEREARRLKCSHIFDANAPRKLD